MGSASPAAVAGVVDRQQVSGGRGTDVKEHRCIGSGPADVVSSGVRRVEGRGKDTHPRRRRQPHVFSKSIEPRLDGPRVVAMAVAEGAKIVQIEGRPLADLRPLFLSRKSTRGQQAAGDQRSEAKSSFSWFPCCSAFRPTPVVRCIEWRRAARNHASRCRPINSPGGRPAMTRQSVPNKARTIS